MIVVLFESAKAQFPPEIIESIRIEFVLGIFILAQRTK